MRIRLEERDADCNPWHYGLANRICLWNLFAGFIINLLDWRWNSINLLDFVFILGTHWRWQFQFQFQFSIRVLGIWRINLGAFGLCFQITISIFKQYFTHYHILFYPHVFSQIFSRNNFQFLNTCTKWTLNNPINLDPSRYPQNS